MKASIVVEESGTGKTEADRESQLLLHEFVTYISQRKVVYVEELAARFRLLSGDVVDRLRSLEADGRLSGILDDRGKYIYITAEEMAKACAGAGLAHRPHRRPSRTPCSRVLT